MKKVPFYLRTSIWKQEKVTDPLHFLEDFFSTDSMAGHRKFIGEICEAAYSNRIWRKGSPNTLIIVIAQLEALVNAAFILRRRQKTNGPAFNPGKVSTKFFPADQKFEFVSSGELPTELSKKELKKPLKAFSSFFTEHKIKEWKEILGELFYHALGRGNMHSIDGRFNAIRITRYLKKIIEASYLIHLNNAKEETGEEAGSN